VAYSTTAALLCRNEEGLTVVGCPLHPGYQPRQVSNSPANSCRRMLGGTGRPTSRPVFFMA